MAVSESDLQGLLVDKLDSLNSDFHNSYEQWKSDYESWVEHGRQGNSPEPPQFPDFLGQLSIVITDYLNSNVEIEFHFNGTNPLTSATESVDATLGVIGINVQFTKSQVNTPEANDAFFTSKFQLGYGLGTIFPSLEWEVVMPMFSTDVTYMSSKTITFGRESGYINCMKNLSKSICDFVRTNLSTLIVSGVHTSGGFEGSGQVTRIK